MYYIPSIKDLFSKIFNDNDTLYNRQQKELGLLLLDYEGVSDMEGVELMESRLDELDKRVLPVYDFFNKNGGYNDEISETFLRNVVIDYWDGHTLAMKSRYEKLMADGRKNDAEAVLSSIIDLDSELHPIAEYLIAVLQSKDEKKSQNYKLLICLDLQAACRGLEKAVEEFSE